MEKNTKTRHTNNKCELKWYMLGPDSEGSGLNGHATPRLHPL